MLAFHPIPTDTSPSLAPLPAALPARWDIFCQVIDNFGDIGVCWRLAAELGARGAQVRLHMDDASALAWIAPHGAPGVQVCAYDAPPLAGPAAAEVVVEAFGCEAPAVHLAALVARTEAARAGGGTHRAPVLVNLEYLSAEDYVARCHRLPSRLMSGPGTGLTRWFFYPGLTPDTGGLLRERALPARQAAFDRTGWRAAHGLQPTDTAISLFCYEPAALPQLLAQLTPPRPGWQLQLLVTPGRATAAVQALLPTLAPTTSGAACAPQFLPARPQTAFDEMLWACDVNLVRGEDSLVRALWAGQPMVWHIYPQDDGAHHAKLNAFLDWLRAPDSLRAFHHAWNGMAPAASLPLLTPEMLGEWQACMQAARGHLLAQTDLIAQLQPFVAEKS